MKYRNLLSLSVALILFAGAGGRAVGEVITPVEKIDFLGEREFSRLVPVLNEAKSETMKRDEVFRLVDGVLRVSGKVTGYLRTAKDYRDYHLVMEYQWGERTWGSKADKARDGGVMLHAHGKDGAYAGTWIASVQAQLLEGKSGNIEVLSVSEAETSLTVEGELTGEQNGRKLVRWKKGGEKLALTTASVDWEKADPAWKNVRGFRGANDVENPVAEWNRLEVICEADKLRIILNGQIVNEGIAATPSQGKICLQSEGAEYRVRRFELWPLNWFREEWKDVAGPTNMGAGGKDLLPRRFPLSPEDSMAAIEIDPAFELQLVAAEPLVNDPVDIVFDEKGRVYVAEMRDYPLPPEGDQFLSRIRLLKDKDGDGRMDEANDWATGLDHVQGLLPMRGGLLVTTRTAILFMRDADGDDVADETKVLFRSNEPRHSQLQISSPRWGIDNHVYLNNGLDATEIYPEGKPEKKIALAKRNLRYDPAGGGMAAVTGKGQFGATLDNWGRRFSSSNRNPVMFAVMPLHAVERNPFAALTDGHEDIALAGGEATVFPSTITHTTSHVHHGTHTAACGLGVYRGDLIPDLENNVFVCEPPGQLVARSVIAPKGASLWAERARPKERTEFLRSSDEWFRPVNIRNGPDGALYICDMYRRFIDHARFFPEEFSEVNYMRAGLDEGRIYRVIPKGKAPEREAKGTVFPAAADELVKLLAHPNAWHRETAQRLLVAKGDASVVPLLESMMNNNKTPATGRVHMLWAIDGLGKLEAFHVQSALADPVSGIVENALLLAERFIVETEGMQRQIVELTSHESRRVRMLAAAALGLIDGSEVTGAMARVLVDDPQDAWLRRAVLSGAENRTAGILRAVSANESFKAEAGKGKAELVREFCAAIAARGEVAEMKEVFLAIGSAGEEMQWWSLAAIDGLAQGLRRHGGDLGTKSLAALLAKPPPGLAEVTGATKTLLEEASGRMLDGEASTEVRLAAIALLGYVAQDKALGVFDALVAREQPIEIQEAAFAAMKRFNRVKLADLLFERWAGLGSTGRREALAVMVTNTATAKRLMQKMADGEINPAIMDPMSRWKYGRSTNAELKALADRLWGQPAEDRQRLLDNYSRALEMKGDVGKGREVWLTNCSTCHKVDGKGQEVGPDISDVRNKTPEALLTDIFDPNRVVESRWTAHAVETSDGRNLTGVIVSETASTVVIKGLGVDETLGRAEIVNMTSLDLSLMPVGLEAAVTVEQMADLLAFLRER